MTTHIKRAIHYLFFQEQPGMPHSEGIFSPLFAHAVSEQGKHAIGFSYPHQVQGGGQPHTGHAHEYQVDFLFRAAELERSVLQTES